MKPWIKEDDDDEACGSGCIYIIYVYMFWTPFNESDQVAAEDDGIGAGWDPWEAWPWVIPWIFQMFTMSCKAEVLEAEFRSPLVAEARLGLARRVSP